MNQALIRSRPVGRIVAMAMISLALALTNSGCVMSRTCSPATVSVVDGERAPAIYIKKHIYYDEELLKEDDLGRMFETSMYVGDAVETAFVRAGYRITLDAPSAGTATDAVKPITVTISMKSSIGVSIPLVLVTILTAGIAPSYKRMDIDMNMQEGERGFGSGGSGTHGDTTIYMGLLSYLFSGDVVDGVHFDPDKANDMIMVMALSEISRLQRDGKLPSPGDGTKLSAGIQ